MYQRTITRKNFRRSSPKDTIFDDYTYRKERALFAERASVGANERDVYIVGDLNGNAMKMLEFIAVTGLVSQTAMNKAAYAALQAAFDFGNEAILELYDLSDEVDDLDVQKKALEKFRLERAELVPSLVKHVESLKMDAERAKTVRLVFVGDTLNDRSYSDAVTLAVFELLEKNEVFFSVAISNHDARAITKAVTPGCWKTGKYPPDENSEFRLKYALQSVSFDCDQRGGSEFSEACLHRFFQYFLPNVTVVDIETLYQRNRKIVCATTHAPYDIEHAEDLEAELFSFCRQQNIGEGCELYTAVKNDELDALRTNCKNINLMFRSIVNDAMKRDDWKNVRRLVNGKMDAMYEFVWHRTKAVKAHDDFFNVFGHDPEQSETILDKKNKPLFKRGVAFEQKLDPKKHKGYGKGSDLVDVGNTLCLDNGSGRPGEYEPTLCARIATVPDQVASLGSSTSLGGARTDFEASTANDLELKEARKALLRAIADVQRNAEAPLSTAMRLFGVAKIAPPTQLERRCAALKKCVEGAKDFDDLVFLLALFAQGTIDRALEIEPSPNSGPDPLARGLIQHLYEIPRLRDVFKLVDVPTEKQQAVILEIMKKRLTKFTAWAARSRQHEILARLK